ncbi:MAG: PmoA family protein [Candidatus Omnitrophica bacterium]|nr:PmoA family protein [Candidatus Omnitrophota bacterium]
MLAILVFLGIPRSCPAQELTAVKGEERIDVAIDGELFTSYRHPSDWKFPYLYPLIGPYTGKTITIEKGVGHPHHRSLYFAIDKVNGGNYWQEGLERGRMVSQGPKVVETGDRVVITDVCDWERDGAPSPVRDYRRVTIEARSHSIRTIQFDIEIEFKIDTEVLPSNHALFSAEVLPELSAQFAGKIVDAEGNVDEAGTFGVKSVWCDYSGERNGIDEGVAILQHPSNPCFPWQNFTRDYGFMSPTPMYWIPEEGLHYKAGDKVAMSFLVVVHGGTPKEADIDSIYREWSETQPLPASNP